MLQTMLLQSWLGICRVKNPRPCCELYHRPTFTIRFGKQQRSESSLIIKYYRNLVFKNTRCPVKSDVYSNSLPLYGDTSLRLSTPPPWGKLLGLFPPCLRSVCSIACHNIYINYTGMLRGMAATIRKIVSTSKAPGAIGPYK